MIRTPARRLLIPFLAAFAVGCGGPSDQPDLGTVSGVVTLDGQPLPDATVTFTPEEGRSSFGVTDGTGHYELQYTNDAMGAKVGPHTVTISTATAATGGEGGEGDATVATPELVPKRYSEPGALTGDIEAGENTIDFDLTSKGA